MSIKLNGAFAAAAAATSTYYNFCNGKLNLNLFDGSLNEFPFLLAVDVQGVNESSNVSVILEYLPSKQQIQTERKNKHNGYKLLVPFSASIRRNFSRVLQRSGTRFSVPNSSVGTCCR